MINPNHFFALIDNSGEIKIEARVTDSQNREIWGELPDSFTADDMSRIAQFFENQARYMRGEHLN